MDVFHIFPLYFPVISFLKKNKEPALLKQSVGGGNLQFVRESLGLGIPGRELGVTREGVAGSREVGRERQRLKLHCC